MKLFLRAIYFENAALAPERLPLSKDVVSRVLLAWLPSNTLCLLIGRLLLTRIAHDDHRPAGRDNPIGRQHNEGRVPDPPGIGCARWRAAPPEIGSACRPIVDRVQSTQVLLGWRCEGLSLLHNIGDKKSGLGVAGFTTRMRRFGRYLNKVTCLHCAGWLTLYGKFEGRAFQDIRGFNSRMLVSRDRHSRLYCHFHK